MEKNQIAVCNEVLELEEKNEQDKNVETGKSVFEVIYINQKSIYRNLFCKLMILLRKICNHPAQLLNDKAFRNSTSLHKPLNKIMDYENSGKFLALK